VLTNPPSVDSISTSRSREDHVSTRKALIVVENVETVVALEILAACPYPATGAPPRRPAERHIGQRLAQ
jgi:histidine ammonia-lyase